MADWKAKLSRSLDRAYARYGDPAVFSRADGDPAPVTVLLDHGAAGESEGADEFGQTAVIRCRISEIATVPAAAAFTVDGEAWEVGYAVKSPDNTEWIAACSRRG